MYTGTASSCLVFLALGFLTFVHSVTSLPVQTNTWVTADQHEDSYSRGQWGVFAKEVQTSLLNPSHVNKINSPTWRPKNHHTDATERGGPNYPYTKGVTPLGNPIVSVSIPTSLGSNTNQLQKDYPQYMKQKSKPKSELEESSRHAIAADRQHRYDEILRYMHVKNAAHQEHSDTAAHTPHFSSSGRTVTLFSYRFSIPTLRLQTASLRGYSIPGVFTTVIILLVMVWIAMFTIGLVELGNYLWSRQGQAAVGVSNCDLEEQSVELDELAKIPLRVVLAFSDDAQPGLPLDDHEYLDATTDYPCSGSESDEDDYRIF